MGANSNKDANWGRGDGSLDGVLSTVAGATVLDDYDVVSAARWVYRAYDRSIERPVGANESAHMVGKSSRPGVTTAETVEVLRTPLDHGVN